MERLQQRLQQRIRASKLADDDLEESDLESEAQGVEDIAGSSSEDSLNERSTREDPQEERQAHVQIDGASDGSSDGEPIDELSTLANVSFGTLASAQAALGKSLKRKRQTTTGDTPPRPAKRQSRSPSPFHEAAERRAGKKLDASSSSAATRPARSSKHAPTEISSKKAVSRKRSVVSVPRKPEARDPRFSSLSGRLDDNSVRSNYAFLDDYRASELAELRARIKREKDGGRRGALEKQAEAMENRDRARKKVEEEQAVRREHRRREQEAVAQGKKPFFLKRGEVKKQVLQKQFEGMSEKKAERVMERKRKKRAAKERKHMPYTRRVEAGGD